MHFGENWRKKFCSLIYWQFNVEEGWTNPWKRRVAECSWEGHPDPILWVSVPQQYLVHSQPNISNLAHLWRGNAGTYKINQNRPFLFSLKKDGAFPQSAFWALKYSLKIVRISLLKFYYKCNLEAKIIWELIFKNIKEWGSLEHYEPLQDHFTGFTCAGIALENSDMLKLLLYFVANL